MQSSDMQENCNVFIHSVTTRPHTCHVQLGTAAYACFCLHVIQYCATALTTQQLVAAMQQAGLHGMLHVLHVDVREIPGTLGTPRFPPSPLVSLAQQQARTQVLHAMSMLQLAYRVWVHFCRSLSHHKMAASLTLEF